MSQGGEHVRAVGLYRADALALEPGLGQQPVQARQRMFHDTCAGILERVVAFEEL